MLVPWTTFVLFIFNSSVAVTFVKLIIASFSAVKSTLKRTTEELIHARCGTLKCAVDCRVPTKTMCGGSLLTI